MTAPMRMRTVRWRAAVALVALVASAQAQDKGGPVYRCGNASYSSSPCPGGVKVDAADPRSPDQKREGESAAAADKRLAAQLAREREARERAVAGQKAVSVGPSVPVAAPSSAASAPRHKKTKTHAKAKAARKSPPAGAAGQAADRPKQR